MHDREREHNSAIRREGRVFVHGVNQTRCGRCGAVGAEYGGDLGDDGRDLALCPDGCPDDDEE